MEHLRYKQCILWLFHCYSFSTKDLDWLLGTCFKCCTEKRVYVIFNQLQNDLGDCEAYHFRLVVFGIYSISIEQDILFFYFFQNEVKKTVEKELQQLNSQQQYLTFLCLLPTAIAWLHLPQFHIRCPLKKRITSVLSPGMSVSLLV